MTKEPNFLVMKRKMCNNISMLERKTEHRENKGPFGHDKGRLAIDRSVKVLKRLEKMKILPLIDKLFVRKDDKVTGLQVSVFAGFFGALPSRPLSLVMTRLKGLDACHVEEMSNDISGLRWGCIDKEMDGEMACKSLKSLRKIKSLGDDLSAPLKGAGADKGGSSSPWIGGGGFA